MNKKNFTFLSVIVVVAGVLYALSRFNIVSPFYLQIAQYMGIYSIMVLGINLVNGYLGIFSLGHAGIMAIGAYSSALFSKYVFTAPSLFPLCLILGGLMALLSGFVVSIPSFRVRGDYLAIVTLGFTLILKSLFQNMEFIGGALGLRNIPNNTTIVWVFIWLVIAITAVRLFINSKYGRSMLAIREDEIAAELSSVDVKKTKIIVFGLSAFLIGISGGLLSHLLSYTNPNTFGYGMIAEGLIMVYLGGIASISGSVLGASLWTLLVEILRPLGVWRWIVGAVLLICIMIYRPSGLMGNKEFSLSLLSFTKNSLSRKTRTSSTEK